MGSIINPRGASGSGKTELARRILADYGWTADGEPHALHRPRICHQAVPRSDGAAIRAVQSKAANRTKALEQPLAPLRSLDLTLPTLGDAAAWRMKSGFAPVLSPAALFGASFFSVLLALLFLIGFIIWQAEHAQNRVRQSIEARTAAEALVSVIRDAELQQRNLIISDEPDYRARLHTALARIPVELSRLLAESDEATQEERGSLLTLSGAGQPRFTMSSTHLIRWAKRRPLMP
jgi:hypothetical protein